MGVIDDFQMGLELQPFGQFAEARPVLSRSVGAKDDHAGLSGVDVPGFVSWCASPMWRCLSAPRSAPGGHELMVMLSYMLVRELRAPGKTSI